MEFDIQSHLIQMETRIRTDIAAVGTAARRDADAARQEATEARAVADAATLANTGLDGRVKSLEEKAGWIGMGFGATVIAAGGFVWHVITGKS